MKSISKRRARDGGGSGCSGVLIGLFCLVFAAIGLVATWFITIQPILQMWASRAWPAERCEVLASEVAASSDGDTYRIHITYRYHVNDRPFTSERYDFSKGSDSARAAKVAIVDRFLPGRVFDCYVDPENPVEAVIDRGFRWGYLWGLVFFVMFTAIPGTIGTAVLASYWRTRRSGAAVGPAGNVRPDSALVSSSFEPPPQAAPIGPVTLKPSAGPFGRFMAALFLCLFWNGIVAVATYAEVTGQWWQQGEWFLALFLMPFQLVGLVLIVAVVYTLLALVNPRPVLTLSSASAPLGGTMQVDWRLRGLTGRISHLTISLEGHEEATYRQGTSTATDKHVFHASVLMETSDQQRIKSDSRPVLIPPDSMHSFASGHNKIVWELKVRGAIAHWPDVDEAFPIQVTAG